MKSLRAISAAFVLSATPAFAQESTQDTFTESNSPNFQDPIDFLKVVPILPETDPPVASDDETQRNLIQRNLLYREQRVRAYSQNPALFFADRAALRGGQEAEAWQSYMRGDISFSQLTQAFPSASISGTLDIGALETTIGVSASTAYLYDLTQQPEQQRLLREAMLNNVGQMYNVAGHIQRHDYSSSNDGLTEYLNLARDFEDSAPQPLSFDALQINHPDLASAYEILNLDRFSGEALNRLLSGEMDLDNYLEETGQSATEFHDQIALELERRQIALPDSLMDETRDASQREAETRDLNNRIAEARQDIDAFSSVLGLIDPELGRQMSQAGNGIMTFSQGLGNLAINGLSIANIGMAYSGYGMFIAAFAQMEDPTQAKLDQILAKQRLILERLTVIYDDIQFVKSQLEYIQITMERGLDAIQNDLDNIQNRLREISHFTLRNSVTMRTQAQESAMREVGNIEAGIYELFDPNVGGLTYEELIACQLAPRNCSSYARTIYDRDLRGELLGPLHTFITRAIADQQTFVGSDIFDQNYTSAEVNELFQENMAVEHRVSLFSGMMSRLADDIETNSEILDRASINVEGRRVEGVNTRVGHPYYNSVLTTSYVDAASLLPQGWVRMNNRVNEICTAAIDIEDISADFRRLAPAAYELYLESMGRVTDDLFELIEQGAQDDAYALNGITDHIESQLHSRFGILFAGQSERAIRHDLGRLSTEDIVTLGVALGVFDTPSTHERRHIAHLLTISPCVNERCYTDRIDVTGDVFLHINTYFVEMNEYTARMLNQTPFERIHYRTETSEELVRSGANRQSTGAEIPSSGYRELTTNQKHQLATAIIAYVQDRNADLTQGYLTNQVEDLPAFQDFMQYSLVMDTLLRGGYGSCAVVTPELEGIVDLRDRISGEYLHNITSLYDINNFDRFLNRITASRAFYANERARLENGDLSGHRASLRIGANSSVVNNACSLGMGQQHITRRALRRATEYQNLRPSQRFCPIAYDNH